MSTRPGSLRTLLAVAAIGALLGGRTAAAGVSFSVTVSKDASADPVSGRLLVLLVRDGAGVEPGAAPLDGPFWTDPQPLYGIDVNNMSPGAAARLDDGATSFPDPPGRLPAGSYRAQARLDVARASSQWDRDPGNLFTGAPVKFTVEPGKETVVDLLLDSVTTPKPAPKTAGVELFETRSALLSTFRGRDVVLRAGVRLPLDYDPAKSYAAVYEVPGFGGDHRGAYSEFRRAAGAPPDSDAGRLARGAFWIVLDPEGPNGHTLFVDSDVNGPCGAALVTELLPALEARYHLIAAPEARLLRGHSSGGWSTLWLALTYPDTFGACWSSAPDPVDFRRMQRSNIYSDASMYAEDDPGAPGKTRPTPSFRAGGAPKMTVRQENLMEEVLGPRNTSAQQWDSWLAAWGPRGAGGHPADLYDPATGTLDHAVAERYRSHDIGDLLRKNPGTLGPIFKQRVRLIVGDQDSFYLNEAVALLKQDVDRLSFLVLPEGDHGYIKIVPGADHGTVLRSTEGREVVPEMLAHLKARGVTPR